MCNILYHIVKIIFSIKKFLLKNQLIYQMPEIFCIKNSFIILTVKAGISFFTSLQSFIYIYFRSISIWSYEILTTDSLKSRISMATNHRLLFLFCVVEEIKSRLSSVRYFLGKKKREKKKSQALLLIPSTSLEIDVSLFGIHEGKTMRGDFLSKPLRMLGQPRDKVYENTLYSG